MNNAVEYEVYRILPEMGEKYYEHAEYKRKEGRWSQKNERYFTDILPRYVGKLIKRESYGFGDGSTMTDIFLNEYNETIRIPYSYEGRTCFREVPCKEMPSLFETARRNIRENIDYSNYLEYIKDMIDKEKL